MKEQLEILVNSQKNDLIGNKIHEIDKYTLQAYNKELSTLQITFQQALVILHIFYDAEQEIYQKNLEQRMGLTNPSVTSLIKAMMSKDLVYRIQSQQDARYFHLHLTPKSLSLVDDIIDRIFRVNTYIMSALSESEQATLTALLKKMSTFLTANK